MVTAEGFVSTTDCNACGDCCEVIQLHFSQDDVRQWPEGRFRHWVLEELEPITREEADTINPGLARQRSRIAEWTQGRRAPSNFYRCGNFDAVARTCTIHEHDLPFPCAGFPWYNGRPDPITLIPYDRCVYHADVAATEAHLERGRD